MKRDLLRAFQGAPYFTIAGFRQIAGEDDPHTVRVLLHRWAQAGHILALKKGVYMTRRFADRHGSDPSFPAVVSAILLPQSYLSLEFILQRHGILTEVTHPVTAITTRNTRRIENTLGTFWYRHIQPKLYHGFTIEEQLGVRVARASPAKALFDYLYFRPIPAAFRASGSDLAGELRLNLEDFSATDREEFRAFVRESGIPKMEQIQDNLGRHAWRP
jgi:predicted transcriptional regulator of viral defense system